jgi:hypothetical protein
VLDIKEEYVQIVSHIINLKVDHVKSMVANNMMEINAQNVMINMLKILMEDVILQIVLIGLMENA